MAGGAGGSSSVFFCSALLAPLPPLPPLPWPAVEEAAAAVVLLASAAGAFLRRLDPFVFLGEGLGVELTNVFIPKHARTRASITSMITHDAYVPPSLGGP